MTVLQFLFFLLIAGICGALGQAIAGYSHLGCLATVALGFIGALLGSWVAGHLGLPEIFGISIAGVRFPVIWSIAGAALFVAVLGLFRGRPGARG